MDRKEHKERIERILLKVLPFFLPVWFVAWTGITVALHLAGKGPLWPPLPPGIFVLL